MKAFRKLAILGMTLALCFGAGAAVACGGNTGDSSTNSSTEQTAQAYEFTVLNADGSAAANINVQLCVLNSAGEQTACYMPVLTDANGKASYNPVGFPGAGEYVIHLLPQDMSTQLEFTGPVTTPTIFSEITLTLK